MLPRNTCPSLTDSTDFRICFVPSHLSAAPVLVLVNFLYVKFVLSSTYLCPLNCQQILLQLISIYPSQFLQTHNQIMICLQIYISTQRIIYLLNCSYLILDINWVLKNSVLCLTIMRWLILIYNIIFHPSHWISTQYPLVA